MSASTGDGVYVDSYSVLSSSPLFGSVGADLPAGFASIDDYFDAVASGAVQSDVTQERDGSDPQSEGGASIASWVSNLITSAVVSCSGAGIPCYLNRNGPLDLRVGSLVGGGYGVHAKYLYTVEDIFGDPTPVDSVTESLTLLAGTANAPLVQPTTWTELNGLTSGLFFPDFIEGSLSADGYVAATVVFQTFTAMVGGNTYSLVNQNTITLAYGPGGPTGSIGVANSYQHTP